MTRICAFSDLHGALPDPALFPKADLYLLGGDVCPLKGHEVPRQEAWLAAEFSPWIASLEERAPVVWVGGNHDFALADRYGTDVVATPGHEPAAYLQDAAAERAGVRVWGSPHSVYLPYWAFMWPEADDDGFTLADAWARIDERADVLLVHGPPFGYGDLLTDGVRRVGSSGLAERFAAMDAALLVCGHIHEGYGHWEVEREGRPPGLIVNASLMNEDYELVNEPVVVELEAGAATVLPAESELAELGISVSW